MSTITRTGSIVTLIFMVTLAGCSADKPLNPSFPLTMADAENALEVMSTSPKPLDRPVVILGGYLDVGLTTSPIASKIRAIGGGENVLAVHFLLTGSFDDCRDHLVEEIEAAFPSNDPNWTTEVDVIGGSMGGIVARFSALPQESTGQVSEQPQAKRLKIARLFTIGTPHRGAAMAGLPSVDSKVVDMRPGSDHMKKLDDALCDETYELIPYVRLSDMIVGAENASPPGVNPWWVQNQPLQFAHLNSFSDRRILADIARRLRGETPYTTSPAAPLPAQ